MTRRSITTVLGSLLVGLLLFVTAPAVAADDMSVGSSWHIVVSAVSQRTCTHPTIGFPTCYTQHANGMWAREELADTNAAWVVVSMVSFDEVVTVIGEEIATAP